MSLNPQISDLQGAHKFWIRYGITIQKGATGGYVAIFPDDRTLQAPTLNSLWVTLGDALIKQPTAL